MPFRGDPAQHLVDIEESITLLQQFVGAMSLDEYGRDRKTRDAVERRLLVISEAAKRLGHDADRLAPEIPWGEIRGFGNWLRHGYDQLELAQIWSILKEDLPTLGEAVRRARVRLAKTGEDRSEQR